MPEKDCLTQNIQEPQGVVPLTLRLERDGSFDPCIGFAGGGFTLKDPTGRVIMERGFLCHSSAQASLKGLRLAHCYRLQHFEVYSDSLRLINSIGETHSMGVSK